LGVNFVLLTAGVDLSVGAIMYLAAVTVSLTVPTAPIWAVVPVALLVGAVFGGANGLLIVGLSIPPFIATLATAFIGKPCA
jgi:ribose/xylose/arabinose/galactoside ABC-type transport system permease subunit